MYKRQVLAIDKDTGGPRGSGILKHLRLPVNLSIRNLCTLMIILSDNTASNKMIDLAGFKEVTDLCKSLGAPDIVLRRYFIGSGMDDISKDNTISPRSLGIILDVYKRQPERAYQPRVFGVGDHHWIHNGCV